MRTTTQAKTAKKTPAKKTTSKPRKANIVPAHERPLRDPEFYDTWVKVQCTREQEQRWQHAFYHGPERTFDEWYCRALDIAAQNPPVYRLSRRFSAGLKRLAHQYALDMYEIADRLMYRAIREADNRIAHRIDPFEPQLIDDFDCTDSADRMCVADLNIWENHKKMRIQEYLLTEHNSQA